MIRPTARLRFELNPAILNDDTVADLKRCYLNVAPLHIGPRPDIKDPRIARNVLGLVVVLHYPYWNEGGTADENWNGILMPWLKNKLYKLNATVQNYNTSRRRNYIPMIQYGQLEIILDNRVVAVQLPSSSAFPEEIPALLDRLRGCVLDGCFGNEEFVRVEMPWIDPASLPEEPAEAEVEAETEAEAVAEAEEPAAEPEAAEAAGVEEPTEETEAADEAEEPAEEKRELEPLPEPDMPIDYTLWGIRREDGTVRVFDSEKRTWL
ncbi:MAG: hypothetical protein IKD70_01400 [Eggerthellaceae bacterium]|nr:hypothetical protein [Eggerthellaceae bacterium]